MTDNEEICIYSDTQPSSIPRQGDIFILDNDTIKNYLPAFLQIHDSMVSYFIITSNSCDILKNFNKNQGYLSFSPILSLNLMLEKLAEDLKRKGKEKDIEKETNELMNDLYKYNKKQFYYLPKDIERDIKEDCVAWIEIIITQEVNKLKDIILKNIKCTLKSPWKEKLGWRLGYLYNRVSLEDFEKKWRKVKTKELIEEIN